MSDDLTDEEKKAAAKIGKERARKSIDKAAETGNKTARKMKKGLDRDRAKEARRKK